MMRPVTVSLHARKARGYLSEQAIGAKPLLLLGVARLADSNFCLIPIQPQQRSFSESNSIIAPQPVAVTQCIPPRLIAFPSSGRLVPALRPFEIMPSSIAHGQHTSPAPLRTVRTCQSASRPQQAIPRSSLRCKVSLAPVCPSVLADVWHGQRCMAVVRILSASTVRSASSAGAIICGLQESAERQEPKRGGAPPWCFPDVVTVTPNRTLTRAPVHGVRPLPYNRTCDPGYSKLQSPVTTGHRRGMG